MCCAVKHPYTTKKPLFLKNLYRVWLMHNEFNESNTLIIDDTSLKMRYNPIKCYLLVETWHHKKRIDLRNEKEMIETKLNIDLNKPDHQSES